ncbi:MAG: preprotein translocase subunit YajC [Clostridia bacterium]|nr:preprotein translocase subunit YajC [Clostridia bacterium]
MRFLSLLASFLDDAEEIVDETESGCGSGEVVMYVFIGVIIVALVAVMIISSRRNKKRQKESENLIAAVRPGNKVKTIGGICGIVVEVDDEESTFVLETGSEETGKFYIKFDKQAIYQTDAVPESTNPDDKLLTTAADDDLEPLGDDDPYAGIDQIFGTGAAAGDGADVEVPQDGDSAEESGSGEKK